MDGLDGYPYTHPSIGNAGREREPKLSWNPRRLGLLTFSNNRKQFHLTALEPARISNPEAPHSHEYLPAPIEWQ